MQFQSRNKHYQDAHVLNLFSNINCSLTPRQELICELLCGGLRVSDIAIKLYKSPHTIENHIRQIKIKTKFNSTLMIACWYISKKMKNDEKPSFANRKNTSIVSAT